MKHSTPALRRKHYNEIADRSLIWIKMSDNCLLNEARIFCNTISSDSNRDELLRFLMLHTFTDIIGD